MSGECNICGELGCVETNHSSFVGDNDHGDATPDLKQLMKRIQQLERDNYMLKKALNVQAQERGVNSFTIRVFCENTEERILPEHRSGIIDSLQRFLDDDAVFCNAPWMNVEEVRESLE